MSDNGRYESTVEFFRAGRERSDAWRLRAGIRAARMETHYGAGIIDALARDAGLRRTTLYEYRQVAVFVVMWKGLSAPRTFDQHPMLTYSHIRQAMRLEFEAAIDALVEAEAQGLTPDAFGVYVAKLRGKPLPQAPLFDQEGVGQQVVAMVQRSAGAWAGKRVRVTVREIG